MEYRRDIKRLQTFLEGGKKKLLKEMKDEMASASKSLDFERAAILRDDGQPLHAIVGGLADSLKLR